MTVKIIKYDNVKLRGTEGILKLSEDCTLIFHPKSSREQGGETQWDVSALKTTALKSSRDGNRHWIRLKVDGLQKPIILQMETREEVERLRRNLVRVRENTIRNQRTENNKRRKKKTASTTTASSSVEASPAPPPETAPTTTPTRARVPVVTATPVDNHQPPERFRGSDIEDGINTVGNDIPLVSTVILLPNEDDNEQDEDYGYDLEEDDLIQEDNNINDNILQSLRPPPVAQTMRSLRFWDRNSRSPKPRSGDGMKDGVPNICYILFYLLTSLFLILTIVAVITDVAEEDIRDDDYGYYDDYLIDASVAGVNKKELNVFVIPFVVFYILFLIMSAGCCDNTLMYLFNSKTSHQVEEMLKIAIQKTNPKIAIKVHCWHTETRHYTDSNGNRRSSTHKVTTYQHEFPVPIRSCVDRTDYSHMDLHKYKITKVKLIEAFEPDDNFLKYRDKLYNDYKHRDTHCDVTEKMDLKLPFHPCILCVAAGERKPITLHPVVHLICHFLVLPALPFRFWMGYITGKMRLELKKSVQTDPPLGQQQTGRS